MRKVFLAMVVVFGCLFLLTGCVKSEATMTINKDKSMDFSITYLVADYLANLSDSESSENSTTDVGEGSDSWKNIEERGYKVEKFVEDDYSGFKAAKHIKNIDDISSDKEVKVVLSDFLNDDFKDDVYFKVEKGFFKNTYTANFVYNLTDEESEQNDEEIDLSAYTSSISMQYKVVLPVKAVTNNATGVSDDGLTYTWKAPYGKLTNINYSFEMVNTSAYIVCAVIAATVLGGITTLIIFKVRKKSVSKEKEDIKKEKTKEEKVIK